MPRKWKGNGGEEDQDSDGVCIKCDIERVGEVDLVFSHSFTVMRNANPITISGFLTSISPPLSGHVQQ